MKENIFFTSANEIGATHQPIAHVKKFGRGSKVDEISNIKDIAKAVREYVKKKYPNYKFSVTIERYAGGQSMTVALIEADFDPLVNDSSWREGSDNGKYYDVNQFYIDTSEALTPKAKEVLKDVRNFYNQYNYDHSDAMTDYFNKRFYETLSIGRWDKGFVKVAPKGKTPKTPKPTPEKGGSEAKYEIGQKVIYKTSKGSEGGTIKNRKFIPSKQTFLYFIENPRGGVYSIFESNIVGLIPIRPETPETPTPETPTEFTPEILQMLRVLADGDPNSEVGSVPLLQDKDGDYWYIRSVSEKKAEISKAKDVGERIDLTPANINILDDFKILRYLPNASKKLKKIIVDWSETGEFDEGETFNTWNDFQAKAKTIDVSGGGYQKTKLFILWENNRALIDRVDFGNSEGDFDPNRDFIGDYIGNQTGAMYWSNFTSGERKNEALWKDTEEMPELPTPETPKPETPDIPNEDTIWDKAFSSEKLSVEIDIEKLKKAIYSKRRSKQMKFDIARAFGVIKFFDKNLDPKTFAEYENITGGGAIKQERIFLYELDEELNNLAFGNFAISQYSNFEAEDWVEDIVFPSYFEQPLKDDKNKRLLLNYFESKYDKPTPTPDTPSNNSLSEAIELLREENDLANEMAMGSDDPELRREVRVSTNENSMAINDFSADLFFNPEKFMNEYFDRATKKHSYDNSDLTAEEFQQITNTPEFINWFGDFKKPIGEKNLVSKVVGLYDTRQPLIVYHGTWNKTHFSRFKFKKFPVIYFATNKSYAEWFAKLGSGIIYQCFLDIKHLCDFRPLGLSLITWSELSLFLNEQYGFFLPQKETGNISKPVWDWIRKDAPNFALINTIKEQGFTGMTHIEDNPQDILPNGEKNITTAYMIFSPEQAKLVRYVSTGNAFTDIFFMKKGGKVQNALIDRIKNLKL